MELNNKVMEKMGIPFSSFTEWLRIDINQTDVDYIVNVIKKDKCFPLILSAYEMERKSDNKFSMLEKAYAQINIIVFFDKFYNDSNCPKGVSVILFALLGLYRNYVAEYSPKLLSERYRYAERWLETITSS